MNRRNLDRISSTATEESVQKEENLRKQPPDGAKSSDQGRGEGRIQHRRLLKRRGSCPPNHHQRHLGEKSMATPTAALANEATAATAGEVKCKCRGYEEGMAKKKKKKKKKKPYPDKKKKNKQKHQKTK